MRHYEIRWIGDPEHRIGVVECLIREIRTEAGWRLFLWLRAPAAVVFQRDGTYVALGLDGAAFDLRQIADQLRDRELAAQ